MTSPYTIVPASTSIPVLPGGVDIASGVSPGPDTVKLDPFLYPPPFSTAINVAVNTPIVGAGTIVTPAGAAFQVPKNSYGVISSIDLLLDSILITSNVLWTFFINGSAVPGFSPLTILGRNGAASVSASWAGPLRLVIPLGGTFSVQIQDVDGAPYTAGVKYYGWFFPQQR
jgi:hypothetical protein